MNKQRLMIQELQRRGVDPSEPIERKDWDKARLSRGVRTKIEIVRDGTKQAGARVSHTLHLGRVPDTVTVKNLTTCRTNQCGSYGTLVGGIEVCWRCTCAGGRELHVKAARKGEKCPAGLWDNTALTINGKPHA